jgi:hypothetical protein
MSLTPSHAIASSPFRAGWACVARSVRWVVLCIIAIALPLAHAEGIGVKTASLVQDEEGWHVDAQFDVQLSPRLEEAVNRGVPLFFVMDFELSRPRWYWFDEKPIQVSQAYRISYTPLLRQYRLSSGSAYQNFTRFDEVTRVLSRVRDWHVADSAAIKSDGPYEASVRMRLDTAQLPKPFQLNAMASRDWAPASEWHRWSIGR